VDNEDMKVSAHDIVRRANHENKQNFMGAMSKLSLLVAAIESGIPTAVPLHLQRAKEFLSHNPEFNDAEVEII
jgi:hypothetical protein